MRRPDTHRSSPDCRVVVGADTVASLRAAEPEAPVVAVVDEARPTEAVLAQTAGADIVLALSGQIDSVEHQAAVDLAVEAAVASARRRRALTTASRRTGHDVSQSLNVIALAAEAGSAGRLDPAAALDQIASLARDAGADAWRTGRPARSSALVLTVVELGRMLDTVALADDVDVVVPDEDLFVLADERRLGEAIVELVSNARRAEARRVLVAVRRTDARIEIIVSDDGTGFAADHDLVIDRPFAAPPGSDRLGIGLATIAELASELGGSLDLVDPGRDDRCTQLAISLPAFRSDAPTPSDRPVTVDQATAQAAILEGVVRHAPLDESLEAIVSAIEQQLPGAVCSILLLHDGRWLGHGAGAQLPLSYREAIDGVTIGIGQGSCGTAAYTGRPVIASDVTVDRHWVDFRDLAMEHGLRSCWSTPIVAAEDGETLGTFAVYKRTVWRPDQSAIRLVNRFTYLAAVAIEHHRLFGALAESEARFRSAFQGAAAGIALAGLDGTIMKSNPSLSGVVGRPPDRLVGTNLLDLIDPVHRHLVTDSWDQLIDTDAPAPDSVEVVLADTLADSTRPTWLSVHTSLIPGEPDRRPYLYVEVRDVTAARQQLADLRAREAAEAANRAKTDFLALASHELRTPLNAILGFAQVMQLLDLDTEQREHGVEQIVRAGRHLRDLIDELLDLSRIEAGELAVASEPVDVGDVVDEALELVRPLAAAREIELVAGDRNAGPRRARADHRCVRQVVINLVDNAVKYTPVGGRVEVAITSDATTVRIGVSDSGPGISSESLDRIFEPFHRIDRGGDDEREGTGLGLTLCARLMREMGGSIDVTSTVGVGSTFWIDLPALRADHPTEEVSGTIPNGSATARREAPGTVLYVDDDPACVQVMQAALHLRPGLRMGTAATARDAVLAATDEPPDIVLLDIGLPDRSGWDLLAELRAAHPRLPAIVLTAGPDVVPDGVPTPDRVFTKPVDIAEVLVAIDEVRSAPAGGDLVAEPVYALDQ